MRVGSRIRAGCLALLVGVIVTPWTTPPGKAASGPEIEAEVQATLGEFFHNVGSAHELANRAVAILVFPTVVKAGFGIGGEYGEGALHIRGQAVGNYNIISGSIGFQLGAQARSVIIMFMNEQALAQFQATDGWKVGIDGSSRIRFPRAAPGISAGNQAGGEQGSGQDAMYAQSNVSASGTT
jgi:lipid-binding SYLF domain-containing protein